jgi:zinc protease
MGATYGFAAGMTMARGGAAHLLVEGIVDSPQLAAAMGAARAAMESYSREGIPAAELERARARLLARHAVSLTTSAAWVDALLEARGLGWDASAVARGPDFLRAVTPADLQEEFAGCVERLVVGVTADEGVARSAVQTAFSGN